MGNDWEHLVPFGYAPGHYGMFKSLCCGIHLTGVDKRATSCRPCAQKAYDERQIYVREENKRIKHAIESVYLVRKAELDAALSVIDDIFNECDSLGLTLGIVNAGVHNQVYHHEVLIENDPD